VGIIHIGHEGLGGARTHAGNGFKQSDAGVLGCQFIERLNQAVDLPVQLLPFFQEDLHPQRFDGGGPWLALEPLVSLFRPELPAPGSFDAVGSQQGPDLVFDFHAFIDQPPAVFNESAPAANTLFGHVDLGHLIKMQKCRQLAGVDAVGFSLAREDQAHALGIGHHHFGRQGRETLVERPVTGRGLVADLEGLGDPGQRPDQGVPAAFDILAPHGCALGVQNAYTGP